LASQGSTATQEEEEGEEEEQGAPAVAVVIDSVLALLARLGSGQALALIKALQWGCRGMSPVVSVLQEAGLSSELRHALEDAACTNIYLRLCPRRADDHPLDHGSCLVVRRSQSGRVQEETEWFAIGPNGDVTLSKECSCPAEARGRGQGRGAGQGQGQGQVGKEQEPTSDFVESLPFKLTLDEQEKAMRGQVVLPHQLQADGRRPQGFAIEHDFDDEDDDIDDDLDI
jgi:hypothetical protein